MRRRETRPLAACFLLAAFTLGPCTCHKEGEEAGGPPKAFWDLYQKGLQEEKRGQYQAALGTVEAALKEQPRHPGANYEIAGLYQIVGSNQKALEAMTVAMEAAAQPDIVYLLRYVKCLLATGRVEEAALYIGKVVEMDPTLPEPYRDYLTIHLKIHELDKVIAMATTAIEKNLDPKYPYYHAQLHFYRGQAHQRKSENEEAEQDFRKALEICPQYPKPYYDLGNLLVRLGRKEEGEKLLVEYRDLNKVQEEIEKVYTQLGQFEAGQPSQFQQLIYLHTLLGQHRDAESSAASLIGMNPGDPDGYVRMGVVKRNLKEFAQAENQFRKAIAISPTYIPAYDELTLLYATADDPGFRNAETAWRIVEGAKRFGGVGAYSLAELYYSTGQIDRAITILRRALARGEGDLVITKARIDKLESERRAGTQGRSEGMPGGDSSGGGG